MSITLEQLQQAEYDILKRFDEYCTKHSLNYVLCGGTLIGAVRHNAMIPWDDDIDVTMDYKSFQRFLKLIKKEPIKGCSFSWFTTEIEYPLQFAKVRKDNTYMPADFFDGLNLHNGIWMDIFPYFNKPDSAFRIKLQEYLLSLFQTIGEKYRYLADVKDGKAGAYAKRYKIISKCPDFILTAFRKLIFFICGHLGKDDSENIRLYDLNTPVCFSIPRKNVEPTIRHIFFDREFRIPENFDAMLRLTYGDNYMTPIVKQSHVQLEKIKIDTE